MHAERALRMSFKRKELYCKIVKPKFMHKYVENNDLEYLKRIFASFASTKTVRADINH